MWEKKGFTVVELLIVIILMGMILTVTMTVSYGMYAT
jgi:prepilin-type N-terminal cleavage/methylation domain-containing protein